jgi:hypothetical protein
MARYIDKILQPGEWVLYSTNAHWMFFVPAIAAWILAVLFLVLTSIVATDPLISICLAFAVVAGLVALYWTATAWFHRWTTETDVTNMRVARSAEADAGRGRRRLRCRAYVAACARVFAAPANGRSWSRPDLKNSQR